MNYAVCPRPESIPGQLERLLGTHALKASVWRRPQHDTMSTSWFELPSCVTVASCSTFQSVSLPRMRIMALFCRVALRIVYAVHESGWLIVTQ